MITITSSIKQQQLRNLANICEKKMTFGTNYELPQIKFEIEYQNPTDLVFLTSFKSEEIE